MSNAVAMSRAAAMGPNGSSRSDILGRKYAPFSNPFFDQASTYMPPTVKSLFSFCRFFFLTHGVVHAVITKSSEYPITDIVYQHKHDHVVRRWEELMNGVLDYRIHQFEMNLDYYTLGNAFTSPSFPFKKFLVCGACRARIPALENKSHWRYTNSKFWLTCPKCGQSDFAKAVDEEARRQADVGMIRWNPDNISVTYNEVTGRIDYVLDTSADFKSAILMGRKDLVATTPNIFLDSIREKRAIVLDRKSVFHMRRPALSGMMRGWGIPLLMPVLKDAYYMQIMKKAQESVLLTHLTPQTFLFPQPATAGADPFSVTNLANWRDHIRRELARQRSDPSYYGILPFPLGHQTIGENGKSLLLMPEIQQLAEMMVTAMGFPVDLIFGQGTYSGSSVSMRMLENFFLSNVHSHAKLLQWTMLQMGSYLGLPVPTGRAKPFKMADDLQRTALDIQLNQLGKISDTTLLGRMDIKVQDEAEIKLAELDILKESVKKHQLLQAEVAGEVSVVQAKYQARAQEVSLRQGQPPRVKDPFSDMQGSGLGGGPHVTIDGLAAALARHIEGLPAEQKAKYMRQIEVESPEMAQLVDQQNQGPEGAPQAPVDLTSMTGAQGGDTQNPVDMRPPPTQLPPRRMSA